MEFLDAMKKRRSRYVIDQTSPISDERIEALLKEAVTYTPSAFNSQSSRVILLLGEEHQKLWNIVLETLRAIVSEKNFESTESKIQSFLAGHGTILYFEDMNVVNQLIKDNPLYADNFPIWSHQSGGMLQYVVWTLLSQEGLGASLQHYNPLIDEKVASEFDVPEGWKLLAQMPFGTSKSEPSELEHQPIEQRLFVKGK